MIMLSVDYGDARTGIAVCDAMEFLASPVTVIKETYMPKVAKQIAALAEEKKAELVVVGNPVNMKLLETEYGLKTDMMDERLTTVEAHRALNVTNTRGKDRKAVIDAVSAVIILEDYIKQHKS